MTRLSQLFIVLLGCCLLGVGCMPERQVRRILVVHSYEEQYQAYPEFNRQILRQFKKDGITPEIRTLYLDCENYNGADELIRMRLLLDSVSRDWAPEVIMVNEDQATYSLLACNHELIRQTPVVFGGVNYPNKTLIDRYPNVTGFRDRIEFMPNVEMAKELFGSSIDLFTILDYTYLDKQTRTDLDHQVIGHKVFIDTLGRGVEELLAWKKKENLTRMFIVGARNQRLQASMMWILRKYSSDQCYIQLKRDFTTSNIGNICYKPSLTAINEAFGFGEKLLGGYMTSLPIQIEETVGAAARILEGAQPSEMPIVDSRKEYVVDWDVMSQLNIPLDKIPTNYRVIHIPLSVKYPVFWSLMIAAFILSVVALIVLLFWLYRREERRKRVALEALSEEKQTLALAIEGSDTFVWKFENGFFVIENSFWNSQEVTPRELSIEDMRGFIHQDNRKRLDRWGETKTSKRVEQILCDFNGRGYQWWEFRYATVLLESGGYKMAGLLLNVQAVKDRERELEEARHLAEKAEQKHSFLANMSHEIRTPLNSIVGFSNLLVSDEEISPEEKQIYIESINCSTQMLLKLVNDILDMTRMESGAVEFQFEDCPLDLLIDRIFQTHQVIIPSHLQFIKGDYPLSVTVHVDSGRLTQVVSNFLNNASKFTPNGYIKLGYNYLPQTQQAVIYVEDSGRGIPVQEQKMVFSRFYKQDGFTQGAGLGLSICQMIIEKLDGEISLWSEPGKGSRFMVTLPCKPNSQ